MSTKSTIIIAGDDWIEYDGSEFSLQNPKPYPVLLNVSMKHAEIIEGEYPDTITLLIRPEAGLYEILGNLCNMNKKNDKKN